MAGRYGIDELNIFLLMVGLVINMLSVLIKNGVFSILAAVPLGIYVYRMLSKNIVARRSENTKYLNLRKNTLFYIKNFKTVLEFKKAHKYFKCPKCGQKLRVPKGKGTINIKCPKCGEKFIKKT